MRPSSSSELESACDWDSWVSEVEEKVEREIGEEVEGNPLPSIKERREMEGILSEERELDKVERGRSFLRASSSFSRPSCHFSGTG